MTGAVTGFAVGFLLDCLLVEPLGGASLVLLATGYLAGLFRERFEIHSPLVPPLLCMGLTVFAELGFGAVELMLGDRHRGQRPGRPRHPDQRHLRLLPRLADLPRPAAAAAPGPGRGAGRAAPPAADGAGSLGATCTSVPTTVPAPRLALRIAVLGGVAVALFAVLVLPALGPAGALRLPVPGRGQEQPHPRVQSDRAARRHPRPRTATCWSTTAPAWRCSSTPRNCPKTRPKQKAELSRLGKLAHMSLRKVRRTIKEQEEVAAGAPVTLRKDVGYDLVYYLEENQRRFPGVTVQRVFVRDYPDGSRAAHVVGSVGEVSEEELKQVPLQGPGTGRRGRQGRRRVHLRPLPARRAGADQDPGQRTRPADARRPAGLAATDARRQPEADDRPRRAGGRRKRARLARPARRLRDDERRTTARSSGSDPSRPTTPRSSPNR